MPQLDIVGTVAVDVVPIVPNFHNKLKDQLVPMADSVGQQMGAKMSDALGDSIARVSFGDDVGRRIGRQIGSQIADAIPTAIDRGARQARASATREGQNLGGAFARSLRSHLQAAFRAMPHLDIRLSSTGVDAELARVRARMETLSNKRIGIDVSAEDAAAEVERLDEQLRRLGAAHPNVAVRADTATARAALAQVREEIAALTARPGQVRLETDGSFGARLRAVVQEAQASLPEVNVTADTSEAVAEVQSLRAQLVALADQRVGIDVDAATALIQINAVQARLEALSASDADIAVRVDAAAAATQLAALQAQVARLNRQPIKIDTAGAQGAVLNLGIQIAALSAIPALPIVAAGAGAIAAMFVAAAAGAGAFALAAIPAVKGVTEVIALQKQAQEESNRATDDSAKRAVQAQQRAIQMASAQQALAAAHRNAARSIADADRQVEDAQEALARAAEQGADRRRQAARQVADAEQAAADQRRQSARSIADAERSLADAVQRAADQQRDAAQAVADAERRLTDAHRTERDAQIALLQARRDAAAQLAALEGDITRGVLDQRDARLRVLEAEQQLQAAMADPRATDLQRQQAQLAYDQAVQRQKDQAQRQRELEAAADKARDAGVDGAKNVKDAEQRVADAQRATADAARALEKVHTDAARARADATQAVADAEQRVVDAQAASARSARDSAQAIADAQEGAAQAATDAAQGMADAQDRVAEAVDSASRAQVDAADSIASAERGVASARLSATDTTTSAITKADEYRKKLAELTPEQRDLYDSIAGPKGLKAAFKDWSESLQPDVLPLVTRGVNGMKTSLPGLTPLVEGTARGLDTLMDSASREIKEPFWKDFKRDLVENVEPAVVGFGKSFGNIFKGMAGVIGAFLPHMDSIADRSESITGNFADWGADLKTDPEFERFLEYVKEAAPELSRFLRELFGALIDVARAALPWTSIMFDILSSLLVGLSWIANNAPEVVQVILGVYFATKLLAIGIKLVAGLAIVYEAAMIAMSIATIGWGATLNATGVIPIIRAIIIIVGALVLAIMLAWNHFGWFRDAVRTSWQGIQDAASFAWYEVLSPIFSGIWDGLAWVGDKVMWLWENAFSPAFTFITEAGKILAIILLTIVITPIYLAITWLGGIALWLYDGAFKPAFGWIADIWWWLWRSIISPVAGWIGDKAKWLNEKAIQPSMRGIHTALVWIGDTAYWLWSNIVSPVFGWIADKAFWLYNAGIKPPMDLIKKAIGLAADAFESARDDIDRYWSEVSDIVKAPVKVIVDVVYNDGIRKVWNSVADVVGGDQLDPIEGFHTGGIMSGYSPGRDDRVIAVGGGEAVMRPEWTRAVGADYVHAMNAVARQGGIAGVQRLVAAGMPAFADGGVVGWVKGRVKDVGGFFSNGWDMLTDPSRIVDASRDWAAGKMRRFTDNPWGEQMTKIPAEIFKSIKDYVKNAFTFGGGSMYGALALPNALNWAKSQRGKPYQWGGGGNPSYDCSGFMAAIQKIIEGKSPIGRLWSTHAFSGDTAPRGWVRGLRAPFQIGVTNAGVGHTAGTLLGVNVESRGGDGIVVGPRARGAHDPMFTDVYGFKPSMGSATVGGKSAAAAQSAARQMLGEFGFTQGEWPALRELWERESNWRWNATNPSSGAYGIPQSLPASKMAAAGADWKTNPATQIKWGLGYIQDRYGSPSSAYASWLARSPSWYDDGGYLPPGLSLVANGTGSPEPVFTSAQWDTLRASAGAGGRGSGNVIVNNQVFLGDREITDIVDQRYEVLATDTGRSLETGRW
ncbi:aggregation-promoting factor C-terminal-like domain-containing protein [Streptomyces buecherae]|uniref:aggregation-promoting factor C-terminal-like domain-containing protein n=1 Tax=Streptomyces buecherae TaxID=2763006 RepID=UPI003792FE00